MHDSLRRRDSSVHGRNAGGYLRTSQTSEHQNATSDIALSMKLAPEGRPQVSFRLVDSLAGAQTILVVEEEEKSRHVGFPVEEVPEPYDEPQAALTAARERGLASGGGDSRRG